MKYTKYIGVSALIAATLTTFTGCTPQNQDNLSKSYSKSYSKSHSRSHSDGSHRDHYYHHGIDFGKHRNYSYKDGVRSGCDSRMHRWRKDYDRYRHDRDYKYGWDAGYRRCRD